ncbi:hypothetical protein BN2475_1470010 [Paraburkholderia ribeironis]|uniref:Uncharacterized protein n=1 Tax=Paraburkholderia ribeironis TaxID=1247936 RepID=A0A1N7SQ21_9BURK|nr:hypothetical protein BN2475_1470010 [Paraburkholderia ribeironis]
MEAKRYVGCVAEANFRRLVRHSWEWSVSSQWWFAPERAVLVVTLDNWLRVSSNWRNRLKWLPGLGSTRLTRIG